MRMDNIQKCWDQLYACRYVLNINSTGATLVQKVQWSKDMRQKLKQTPKQKSCCLHQYTQFCCSPHPCKWLKERLICNAVERVLVLRGQRAIWPGHHLDDIVALPVQAYNLLSKHVFMTYSTVLYLLLHYKFPATQHVHQSASP